jgi:uncharacterized coiled-coil protein SlyX
MSDLQDLEIKLSFLEKHLLELDAVVRQVCDDLATLRREVSALNEQARGEKPTLEAERPPHY